MRSRRTNSLPHKDRFSNDATSRCAQSNMLALIKRPARYLMAISFSSSMWKAISDCDGPLGVDRNWVYSKPLFVMQVLLDTKLDKLHISFILFARILICCKDFTQPLRALSWTLRLADKEKNFWAPAISAPSTLQATICATDHHGISEVRHTSQNKSRSSQSNRNCAQNDGFWRCSYS